MQIRYFDHAATTQMRKEVVEAMLPFLDKKYGNPSSLHKKGIEAKKAVDDARKQIADLLQAKENEIYFTAGGSEADNLALKGFARANKKKGNHIITSCIEHKAILESCKELEEEGFEITYINVDRDGVIHLKELEDAIRDTTILISIMFANNEIGTLEPIEEIGAIAHKHGIVFHTDAVQAIGNVPISVSKLPIDMLSMSAHKFYGPKGMGVLYVKDGITFQSVISGGGQERGKRAGTENVAGIIGMAKALELATKEVEEYNQKLYKIRQVFLREMQKSQIPFRLNGHPFKRLQGNVNISFPGVEGESLLLLLAEKGICVSTASACSTNHKGMSHVLKAIDLSEEEANGTIRITFGAENSEEDAINLALSIQEIIGRLKEMEN